MKKSVRFLRSFGSDYDAVLNGVALALADLCPPVLNPEGPAPSEPDLTMATPAQQPQSDSSEAPDLLNE